MLQNRSMRLLHHNRCLLKDRRIQFNSFTRYSFHELSSNRFYSSVRAQLKDENDLTVSGVAARKVIKEKKQKSALACYLELSKFRLSSLVVLTTAAGFIATGVPLFNINTASTMAAACFGTALCAASASTFNHVIEHQADSNMNRTKQRPLPSGAISSNAAVAFGGMTGCSGISLLLAATNPEVAALGAANIALYAGAYTYSKRVTEWNTWIGAIVGAIPPVMGWGAAMGGQLLAPEPMALASLLLLWQFPHFFALSWLHREDYARGGFQMVAVNDPTGQRSAKLILEYSVYLTALPIICSAAGLTSYMFALEGTAANMYLLYLAKKFNDQRTNAGARRIFLCSLWYLPLLLTGFVFHCHMWNEQPQQLLTNDDGVQVISSEENQLQSAVMRAKEYLKSLCVHELIIQNENTKNTHLCPKTQSEKVIDAADRSVQAATHVVEEAAAMKKNDNAETAQ